MHLIISKILTKDRRGEGVLVIFNYLFTDTFEVIPIQIGHFIVITCIEAPPTDATQPHISTRVTVTGTAAIVVYATTLQ